jgi:hypothetical protein
MWIVEVYITAWIPTGDRSQFLQPARDMLRCWKCCSPDQEFRIRHVDAR